MKAHHACASVGILLILLDSLVPATAQVDSRPASRPSAQDAVFAALETKTSLEFEDTSLQQIASDIGKSLKINVILDVKALADAGIAPDTALSVQIADVTLRSALGVLLRPVDLTCLVRNEVLWITTPDRASADPMTKSYNVSDLLQPGDESNDDSGDEPGDSGSLEDLLITTISRDSWNEVGGVGSIIAYDNCLVISQTGEVHRQIGNLLAALRKLKNTPDATFINPIWAIDPAELAAQEKIESALARNTSIVVEEMRLAEFADMLAKEERLPVQLDIKAFADAGIAPDTAVNLAVHEITLGSSLALLLERLDLTTLNQNEVLWITTPDVASGHMQVAVYPVGDLVAEEQDSACAEALMDTITTTVDRNTWHEVGGPGSIEAFAPLSCLVIRQTQDAHGKIRQFFSDLRKARGESREDKLGRTAKH